jgi:hypothetical protein
MTRSCYRRRSGRYATFALLEFGDAIADPLHHAGGLQPDTRGEGLDRIETGAMVGIDIIQSDGGMADQDMAGLGGADDDLLEVEDFRPPDTLKTDSLGLLH